MSHVWRIKPYGTFCRWCGERVEEYKTAQKGTRRAMEEKCDALQKRMKKETREYRKKNTGRMHEEQLSLPFYRQTKGKEGQ